MTISLRRGKNMPRLCVGWHCTGYFTCFHFLSSCSEGTLSRSAHGKFHKVLGGQLTVVTGTFLEPQHKARTSEPQVFVINKIKRTLGANLSRVSEKQVPQHPID